MGGGIGVGCDDAAVGVDPAAGAVLTMSRAHSSRRGVIGVGDRVATAGNNSIDGSTGVPLIAAEADTDFVWCGAAAGIASAEMSCCRTLGSSTGTDICIGPACSILATPPGSASAGLPTVACADESPLAGTTKGGNQPASVSSSLRRTSFVAFLFSRIVRGAGPQRDALQLSSAPYSRNIQYTHQMRSNR